MWNRRRVRTCVWIYPAVSASSIVEAISTLDAAGVDEVWVSDEGVAREPFALLAAAAMVTRRITLGVGITSPLLRHPGVVAATAMTIDELSNGRMVLGWGVGGQESLGPFSLATDRPVAVVRDAIETAGAVFRGQTSSRYTPPDHAAPSRTIPQFVGARGPQLNRLASRMADGVFLSGFTTETAYEAIREARSVRPVHVTLCISARFGSVSDEKAIAGDPFHVGEQLRVALETHRPDCIGIALVDRDPLPLMIDRALAALATLGD
ncbi:MAG: LLM class flavin-dependent oxidoreductase [Actinobacteria bacterium]|nr:LLM class flavin-dependent oxidoreductase [Actinomycetota bacterium]